MRELFYPYRFKSKESRWFSSAKLLYSEGKYWSLDGVEQENENTPSRQSGRFAPALISLFLAELILKLFLNLNRMFNEKYKQNLPSLSCEINHDAC